MLHFVDEFMRLSLLHLKSFAKSLELLKAPVKVEKKKSEISRASNTTNSNYLKRFLKMF